MKIGRIIIVVGIVMFVATSIYVATNGNISTFGYPYPGLPVGIGGTVKINGTPAPDGVLVTAKNINTGKEGHGVTENGYYAIGIEARDGDRIVVSSEYNGMVAKNTTTVDVNRVTQWCNLTFGIIKEEEKPWWLLSIPLMVIATGIVTDVYERRKWRG